LGLVLAISQHQNGLLLGWEPSQGALEVDHAHQAGVYIASAAFAPAGAAVIGRLGGAQGGVISGPLAQATVGSPFVGHHPCIGNAVGRLIAEVLHSRY
jgi:hypothetical protein